MKIFIGLVTPDAALRKHFGINKNEGVVPKDSLSRGYFARQNAAILQASYAPPDQPSIEGFEKWLLRETRTADACLLIIDQKWESLAENVRNASFSIVFTQSADTKFKEFFHSLTGPLLRAFNIVASNFEDNEVRQLLSLPLRNFKAPELEETVFLIRNELLTSDFNNKLQEKLKRLRTRRRPRKRTSFKKVSYTVDDRKRFFIFGKEQHARFATGEPHKPYCELTGHFRFGSRVDHLRHYNVSQGEGDKTYVFGDFQNCHGGDAPVAESKNLTHLNMFTNDYF